MQTSSKTVDLIFPSPYTHKAYEKVIGRGVKRVADVVASSIALLMLWPLMIGIAVAIWLIDGGKPIFAQTRVGKNGRPFKCLKFRSMVLNAELVLEDYLANNIGARLEWQANQKLNNDPRITSLGAFLRKSSLDELPQLINILLGEMSLVGPRPIVPAEITRYGENFAFCFSVPPGLTGQWQVSGRSDCSYAARIALDVSYVREWNVWLDASIIVRTIPEVMRQRGSR